MKNIVRSMSLTLCTVLVGSMLLTGCDDSDSSTTTTQDTTATTQVEGTTGEVVAADLATLLVGNTWYMHCTNGSSEWIDAMTFQENGVIETVRSDGTTEYLPYRIEGNTLYINVDGNEMALAAVEITDTYIKLSDGSVLYKSAEAAQSAPAVVCQ